MTVKFFPDEPDDFFESCCCNESFEFDLGECDLFEDEEDEEDQDLTIDFAFDIDGMRLACIYTGGLWQLGLPELYLRPPADQTCGNVPADARLAVFLATGLIHLGYSLLAADDFDIPPYVTDLNGRQVRFWLGGQEPPDELLASNLSSGVDTVIQVYCSLWHAALLGDG